MGEEEQKRRKELESENILLQKMQSDHKAEIAALHARMEDIKAQGASEKEMWERMLEEVRSSSARQLSTYHGPGGGGGGGDGIFSMLAGVALGALGMAFFR